EFTQIQVPRQTEAVVRGDDNNVPGACQTSAILVAGAPGPGCKAAPVAIKHNRPFSSTPRGNPDVEEQAILVCWRLVPALAGLDGRRAELQGIADAGPGLQRRRLLEPVCSRNRTGVRDALKGKQSVALKAAKAAIRCLHLDVLRLL